jgi:glucokinase
MLRETDPPRTLAAAGLGRPWLLADIGGTNARFGWLAEGQAQPAHVATLPTAGHAGPALAARAYLDQLARQLGPAYAEPRAAAWAVATAVGQDEVRFTNSGWAFSRSAVRSELGLDELLVLNDFEALALSLPHLQPQQVRRFGGPEQGLPGGALAVIGPGTGLGVAGLLPTAQGWVAIPGEGGHASLSAADDFEAAVLAAVRQVHPHVSAERLLSGIGLPVLHTAVAQVLGLPGRALSASEVLEGALQAGDVVCDRTVAAFCGLLGSFAGNVALILGARGGVYIGGGIVPRLGERFFDSAFRQRFEAKGRFQSYLQAVPTALITDTLAALTGTAHALDLRCR